MARLCCSSYKILSLALLAVCGAGCRPDPIELKPRSTASVIRKSEVSQGIPLDRLRSITNVKPGSGASPSLTFGSLPEDLLPSFAYENGSRGHRLMVEATGGGCGWLDLDQDSQWDLYLVQGGVPDEPPGMTSPTDRVWRQVAGRFHDVTGVCGVNEIRYGQGVAAGDFDNDGFDDIFVTNIGENTFFRNLGDGTFHAMEHWGGQESRLWSTSSAWGDIDLDGDLDLYVCNYVNFDPFHPQVCTDAAGEQIQCGPSQVAPVADELYLNDGAGGFEPVAESLGVKGPGNRALGIVIADFSGDSTPEIYVANDATANFMFTR